jgi:transcriptional regulator with XRE-family HTH domain
MTEKTEKRVSHVDALCAIADIVEAMRKRGISINALADSMGWTSSYTEDFLFEGQRPKLSELQAVARELNVKLEF